MKILSILTILATAWWIYKDAWFIRRNPESIVIHISVGGIYALFFWCV